MKTAKLSLIQDENKRYELITSQDGITTGTHNLEPEQLGSFMNNNLDKKSIDITRLTAKLFKTKQIKITKEI